MIGQFHQIADDLKNLFPFPAGNCSGLLSHEYYLLRHGQEGIYAFSPHTTTHHAAVLPPNSQKVRNKDVDPATFMCGVKQLFLVGIKVGNNSPVGNTPNSCWVR
jgi:hypothetical protein